MSVADPQTICLTQYMADKGPLWEEITAKYKLKRVPNDLLLLRYAGSDKDSLRAKLRTAASLTVEETVYGPRVRRWKPISTLAVRARNAPDDRAATATARPSVDL